MFEDFKITYDETKDITQWSGTYKGQKHGNYCAGKYLREMEDQAKDIYQHISKIK